MLETALTNLPAMGIDFIMAIAVYAFTMSITPGPNNTMLLASGANYGLRRTVPHIMGINLGFSAMLLAVGLGIGGLFEVFPVLHTALKFAGSLYILVLAWKIASATPAPVDASGSTGKPMSFLSAALFQWINPKAWMISIGAAAAYIPAQGYFLNLAVATVVVIIVNLPCIVLWAGAGVVLRRFMNTPATMRAFNVAMALLLVASLYPILKA